MTRSFTRDCFTMVGIVCALLVASGCSQTSLASRTTPDVPVIYCTDLFHPHDDPDDHFDLACIYALDGIDLRAVILDQGDKQQRKPGAVPVEQMNAVTGRDVPAAIGLAGPLGDPHDAGLNQPARYQGGVERIIAELEQAAGPVTVVTTGSVRDLMAAYNRRPGLLREKVGRVIAFIGEASEPAFREYNVSLDVAAYVALMRSDMPVWWVPCFDGGLWRNHGRASYWRAPHRQLLEHVSPPIMNYFLYALTVQRSDPLEFIRRPVDPQLTAQIIDAPRNLWCCAVFVAITDQRIVADGDTWAIVDVDTVGDRRPVFDFEPVRVSVSDDGVVTQVPDGGKLVRQFRVTDPEDYSAALTEITSHMLGALGDPERARHAGEQKR